MGNHKQYDIIEKSKILRKGRGSCVICGKNLDLLSISLDHYIPLSKGGIDKKFNIFPTCAKCNNEVKNDKVLPWNEIYPFVSPEYYDVLDRLYNDYLSKLDNKESPLEELSKTQLKRLQSYNGGMIIKTVSIHGRPEFILVERRNLREFYITVDNKFKCNFKLGDEYTTLYEV